MLCTVSVYFIAVESVIAEECTRNVGYGNNLASELAEKLNRCTADITVALNSHAHFARLFAIARKQLSYREHNSPACRVRSSEASPDFKRLACDNSRRKTAYSLRVGITEPSHYLPVCIHIRRGNIFLFADYRCYRMCILSCESLQFA